MNKRDKNFKCLQCGHDINISNNQCPLCGIHFELPKISMSSTDKELQSPLTNKETRDHLNEVKASKGNKSNNHQGSRTVNHQLTMLNLTKTLCLLPFTTLKRFLQWLFNFDKPKQVRKISLTTFLTLLLFISFEYGLVRYLIQQALHVKIIMENQNASEFLNQISIEVLESWRKTFPARQTMEYFIYLLLIWLAILATSWFSSVITRARSWNDEYDDPPHLNLSLKDLSMQFTLRLLGLLAIYQFITLASFYLMTGGQMEIILTSLHHMQALMADPIRMASPNLANALDLIATIIMAVAAYLYFQFHRSVLAATKLQAFLLSLPPILLMWLFNVV